MESLINVKYWIRDGGFDVKRRIIFCAMKMFFQSGLILIAAGLENILEPARYQVSRLLWKARNSFKLSFKFEF